MKLEKTMLAVTLMCFVGVSLPKAGAQISGDAQKARVPSRLVMSSGTASVQTAPDRVYLTVGVRVWDKDIHAAYNMNEEKSKKLLALAPQFKIDGKNVQTTGISVDQTFPPTRGTSAETAESSIPTGYVVDQSVIFVLDDIKRLRELITATVDAGANHIRSIEFDTSTLRKFKDEARVLALKAAREKAEAMAGVYGAKLGKAVTIEEVGSSIQGLSSNSRYSYFPNSSNNTSQSVRISSGIGEVQESVAPGQLKITSSVMTAFELSD